MFLIWMFAAYVAAGAIVIGTTLGAGYVLKEYELINYFKTCYNGPIDAVIGFTLLILSWPKMARSWMGWVIDNGIDCLKRRFSR